MRPITSEEVHAESDRSGRGLMESKRVLRLRRLKYEIEQVEDYDLRMILEEMFCFVADKE